MAQPHHHRLEGLPSAIGNDGDASLRWWGSIDELSPVKSLVVPLSPSLGRYSRAIWIDGVENGEAVMYHSGEIHLRMPEKVG